MRKLIKGFTLVEMLIVIVIIWILAAAILPKIMGIQARARDTKRQADLRNIAMAITTYKMDYGEYPLTEELEHWASKYVASASDLYDQLNLYIKKIPKDPQKNNFVNIHTKEHNDYQIVIKKLSKGEYLYQVGSKGWEKAWIAVLIAKVETPNMANYVVVDNFSKYSDNYNRYQNGSSREVYRWNNTAWYIEILNFCSSIKKWNQAKWVDKGNGNFECFYTDENQLFYIEKV